MRALVLGTLVATGLLAALPAPVAAQSFGVGPGGVEFDPRTRRQRVRDYERAEMRREMRRDERREMRRRERWDDERRYRRGYY